MATWVEMDNTGEGFDVVYWMKAWRTESIRLEVTHEVLCYVVRFVEISSSVAVEYLQQKWAIKGRRKVIICMNKED